VSDHPHNQFLGRGLHFPVRLNPLGSVELVSAEKDIEQAITIILGTRCGERVMRPDFGCRVHDLLFEPRDALLVGKLQQYVGEALELWEPRIEVLSVLPRLDPDSDGAVLVEINYRIKSTHDQRSIVYPFFIEATEDW
jgi:phage baseplate assembly protein W